MQLFEPSNNLPNNAIGGTCMKDGARADNAATLFIARQSCSLRFTHAPVRESRSVATHRSEEAKFAIAPTRKIDRGRPAVIRRFRARAMRREDDLAFRG